MSSDIWLLIVQIVTFVQIFDPYEEDSNDAISQPQQMAKDAGISRLDIQTSPQEPDTGGMSENVGFEIDDQDIGSSRPTVTNYSVDLEQAHESPSASEAASETSILAALLLRHFAESPGKWSVLASSEFASTKGEVIGWIFSILVATFPKRYPFLQQLDRSSSMLHALSPRNTCSVL